MNYSDGATIARQSTVEFLKDDPFQLAAALSYYTLLSIAPLLLVVTGIAGLLLGETEVRNELINQASDLVGEEGAELLRNVTDNAGQSSSGIVSVVIGAFLTLLGASTVFAQLQVALNRIWRVESVPGNAIFGFVRAPLVSLAVVLGLGFLLLVSLVLSAVLSGLYGYIDSLFPAAGVISQLLNLVVSLVLISLLLALLFRYVPDAQVSWRDTVAGALITAIMFTIGKYAIGLYLGQASVGSAYGAAGSAVVFMVWIYYASLILFFGAKITTVVARHRGQPLVPSPHARLLDSS